MNSSNTYLYESILKFLKRFTDPVNLKRLLYLEKRRRGVSQDKLVFVGIANIAHLYWCGAKAVYKSRKYELMFFWEYLVDRVYYSALLGYIDKPPQREEDLLLCGGLIKREDVEKLLNENYSKLASKTAERVFAVNPLLSPELRELEVVLKSNIEGKQHSQPIVGLVGQQYLAEKYPTVRWNFDWNRYVVIGMPDGITKDFVYEFKTVKTPFLAKYNLPVAVAQADLYGYFFERPKKRVQIYIVETGKTITREVNVDRENAIRTLSKFQSIDSGASPIPPKKWKCKDCEFINTCELRKSRAQKAKRK
jgi:CRISPR/Cas system-associated exonuclease Cas4 (RecB family)